MQLKELSEKVKAKAKEETTKESIKHRLSWSKVSKVASRIRAISGSLGAICVAASRLPNLNGDNKDWLLGIGGVLAAIAGGAWLNKGKK